MILLEGRGLVKAYAGRRVVDRVDFHVHEGEIVGLLGGNGAGKTTTFRIACGMLAPDAGRVYLGGDDVTGWPMFKRARDGGMGYLPQDQSIFRKLTAEENLLATMELVGMAEPQRRARCEELLGQFFEPADIPALRRTTAADLSGGLRRRLEIARCLVTHPRIILLDEPFTGIDPVAIHAIQRLIVRLRDDGIAILITDHRERETLAIIDRGYVIHRGEVLCSGRPDALLAHEGARKHYFGEGGAPLRLARRPAYDPEAPDEGDA